MTETELSVTGSGSSSGRRRGGRYRTINKQSTIDESLFGAPNKVTEVVKRVEKHERNQSAPPWFSGSSKKDKVVQVITKDLIRNLIVPKEDPSGQSIVLPVTEFERIKNNARVLSHQERAELLQQLKREKEASQDACQARKDFMQQQEKQRRKNEKLNELDEEAKQKAMFLLEKANEQRQEQEDEIKELNELILKIKCHAIRDAQVQEKEQIVQEVDEEEKRLDVMMEVDRMNALTKQEGLEKKRKQERYQRAGMILEQIQQNEEEHLLDQERKEQEAAQMRKYLHQMQVEDLSDLSRKRKMQEEMQTSLARENAEILRRQEVAKEQEKLIDTKVTEYMQQKEEREAAFEREQQKLRLEKEKEVARLRTMQERAKDHQAEQDALRAKRNTEQVEREWRRKEKEDVLRKAEVERQLNVAREQQVMAKQHFLAVQAQRDRTEFERVLKAQIEAQDKEHSNDQQRVDRQLQHADDVRKQIRQKELERVQDRKEFFQEGIKLDEEAKLRRQRLDATKRKKIGELRNVGIPEKYIRDVERKVVGVVEPPV